MNRRGEITKEIVEIDLAVLAEQIEKHVNHEIVIMKTFSGQEFKPDQLVVLCKTCEAPLFTTYSVFEGFDSLEQDKTKDE